MSIKKYVVCGGLFLSSVSNASGWTPPLTVSSAFTENSDLIVAYTADGSTYAGGCAANAWMFNADTDARRGRAYATLIAAIVSGKKIQFWYQDTCAAWGFHGASSVRLVQ